ncbi:guanylyltransferase [Chitinophaga agrisoli]|uniref:tRNA(His) guanylyltransferase n=1 Tax=Chitinophaga agrisoli TaxID=2607653 RepID=A0A5B2VZF4_9BACT|nr:tRNA(His) guanylyltransferase Thg1 family protein [Chitinophaga agrisoli]KAA2244415.1 guanylyltransferase [Chitinophaga agrisoli]
MKFDELDSKMRVYETVNDTVVLPGNYIVARIDGRGFTRLTKEVHDFEKPFDIRFRDYMVATVQHLMQTGFNVVYGYTESDEISLLFHISEAAFSRKHRKYNSILAGEASAKFSVLLGDVAAFDCRLSALPNKQLVTDYFRWRNEDAHRNSLNAHCYWQLRKDQHSAAEATKKIERMTTAEKNELLFSYQVNFNDLPSWQKRGIGFYWEMVDKEGFDPKREQPVMVKRRQLQITYELPMKETYNDFVNDIIEKSEAL